MKDNLEAKFYDKILRATKKEIPNNEIIDFKVDNEIDNHSNLNVIDCAKFLKEV
jgi:hypothetical protein